MTKKSTLYLKILILAFVIFLVFLSNQRLFILGLLTLLGGIFGFYHDKYNKTVIDFRLGLVLGILVTRYYTFLPAVIYYLVIAVIPNILAGGRIDGPTLVFHGLYIILFFVASIFPHTDIILLGILLVFVDGILGIFINIGLGIPPSMAILAATVAVTMRVIYFMTIGTVIEFVFGYLN